MKEFKVNFPPKEQNDWGTVKFLYQFNSKGYCPKDSVLNDVTLNMEFSSNLLIPKGSVHLEIENPDGQITYTSSNRPVNTTWTNELFSDLAKHLKADEKDYKLWIVFQGTERRWYCQNGKLTVNYTEPKTNNIFVGTQKVKEVYIGATPVKEVYVGTKQIF